MQRTKSRAAFHQFECLKSLHRSSSCYVFDFEKSEGRRFGTFATQLYTKSISPLSMILTRLTFTSFCSSRSLIGFWRLLRLPCTSFTTPFLQLKIQTRRGKKPYTRSSVNWTATSRRSSRRLPTYRLK